jgi:hypothetical protein
MNEAQKFLLNNECDDNRLKDAHKVEDWIYISDIMEDYHQAQLKLLGISSVGKYYTEEDMDNAYDTGFNNGNERDFSI